MTPSHTHTHAHSSIHAHTEYVQINKMTLLEKMFLKMGGYEISRTKILEQNVEESRDK